MIPQPLWLETAEVIEINRKVVEKTDEPFCLLNPGLLESAVSRPINQYWYESQGDILVLACRLLFAIARDHPFIQGNKRTGFHSAIAFMRWNGYRLNNPPDDEIVGRMIVDVLEGRITEPNFADAIRHLVIEA